MTDTNEYVEHPCTLAAHGWAIPAALTLPTATPEVASAILLVPGSLYSDVNGDYPSWSSFPHVYAHIARQLSARGHAVYRFAKLGPGTGSVASDAKQSAGRDTAKGPSSSVNSQHRAEPPISMASCCSPVRRSGSWASCANRSV